MFDGRVLQVTEDILLKWRLLVEEGRKTAHTFSQRDLIIAATAIHHGVTFVARDCGDYDKAGCKYQLVERLNPWVCRVAARIL